MRKVCGDLESLGLQVLGTPAGNNFERRSGNNEGFLTSRSKI